MKQLNVRMDDDEYNRLDKTKQEDETWLDWLMEAADQMQDREVA